MMMLMVMMMMMAQALHWQSPGLEPSIQSRRWSAA